jgi:hypothetical protein
MTMKSQSETIYTDGTVTVWGDGVWRDASGQRRLPNGSLGRLVAAAEKARAEMLRAQESTRSQPLKFERAFECASDDVIAEAHRLSASPPIECVAVHY